MSTVDKKKKMGLIARFMEDTYKGNDYFAYFYKEELKLLLELVHYWNNGACG